MEESTNRSSAFRVVRPTSCYASSSLLPIHSQFLYADARFPYSYPIGHYREIHSPPSNGPVVTPASDKLKFSYSEATSSFCRPVNSSEDTGLKVYAYEKNDGGHRFISSLSLVAPETGNDIIHTTAQAGQNCGQTVTISSNHVVCSVGKSPCRSEERKQTPQNATCPVCHKVFGRVTTLKVHLRIHRGEKPFKCFYCGKSFSQSGNLTTHIRVHTGEKPFSCKVCGKQFSQSSALKGHMKIHLREDIKKPTPNHDNLTRERPGDEIDTNVNQ